MLAGQVLEKCVFHPLVFLHHGCALLEQLHLLGFEFLVAFVEALGKLFLTSVLDLLQQNGTILFQLWRSKQPPVRETQCWTNVDPN